MKAAKELIITEAEESIEQMKFDCNKKINNIILQSKQVKKYFLFRNY